MLTTLPTHSRSYPVLRRVFRAQVKVEVKGDYGTPVSMKTPVKLGLIGVLFRVDERANSLAIGLL